MEKCFDARITIYQLLILLIYFYDDNSGVLQSIDDTHGMSKPDHFKRVNNTYLEHVAITAI